jgi:hypothetical protein
VSIFLKAIIVAVVLLTGASQSPPLPPSGAYKKASPSSLSPCTGLIHSPPPFPELNQAGVVALSHSGEFSPPPSLIAQLQITLSSKLHYLATSTEHLIPPPDHVPQPSRRPHRRESPATSPWLASS